MKLSSQVFKEGRAILWGDLGGCWARGFLLPSERHYKKVFLDEATQYLEDSETGVYENGRLVSTFPPGKDKIFPLQMTHSLAYAGMEQVPGLRLISDLGEGHYVLILEKKNGQSHPVFVNYAFAALFEIGEFWYQGTDDLSPIIIRTEPLPKLPAKISLLDMEAVVWPMDLRGYKE